jgi:hypothetical protein
VDPKILDKVKKCMALSKSDNANEAATALRQAQALMEKYNINSETLELSEINFSDVDAGAGKTPPRWIAMLINLVGVAFGVEAIYKSKRGPFDSTYKSRVEFIGFDSAPVIAQYAYAVLLRQLKKGRSEFLETQSKRLKRITLIKRGDLYAEGWIESVYYKITRQEISPERSALIQRWKQERHPDLQDGKAISRTNKVRQHDKHSYSQGRRDGRNVVFNQGVGADKRSAITHQGAAQ